MRNRETTTEVYQYPATALLGEPALARPPPDQAAILEVYVELGFGPPSPAMVDRILHPTTYFAGWGVQAFRAISRYYGLVFNALGNNETARIKAFANAVFLRP